ncbi:diguanylate cyclase/phosphodiesterase [Sulfurimonas denitrificans DSM 1251]|uniref:Diguanylate cyclase/phosphodiesterase n=1 Tax=Sulfurimonas denitrificans (strain ATCC 33889 / DSM 1251) TaxID=326298 RepID=Q30P04_SULDN|nr:EAL domain-containing protein [Sulfurimonas denitrificans]ABB45277.1 diguanylate cyclase/phosphodiesterase [Sulfurimonas denitrificans DSM 1251]MDD3442076.1 EAL domain-containing protein [Sulfurimonas denitrificans]
MISKKELNFFSPKPLILISIIWLVVGFIFITSKVETLKSEKYQNLTTEAHDKLKTLINEKKEALLFVTLPLANDILIKEALAKRNIQRLNLLKFSDNLSKNTSLKGTWFQLISSDGKSFYRSWIDKRDDDLSLIRDDVAEMIRNPHVISSISAGIFDITFKSMVPIYKNDNFIGSIEAISNFDSIDLKMRDAGYEIIFLADKKYKKLLIEPSKKTFISDYYVANSNYNKEHFEIVKTKGITHFLNEMPFHVNEEKNKLISTYHLMGVDDKEIAYFIIFQDLDAIDFSSISRVRDSLIFFLFSFFVFLILLSFYIYFTNERREIQQRNINLQKKVQTAANELEHLSRHDHLTNLPNKTLLIDRLEHSINVASKNGQKVSILFLDLDRFKEINDTYNHEVGDKLLQDISRRLKKLIKEEDTIGRFGGDEFIIILNNSNETQTVEVVTNIMSAMSEPFNVNKVKLHTTFSIGISIFPDDGNSRDILIRNADTAMYEAKSNGKNRYQFYDKKMTELAFERTTLESNLRKAIQNEEFEVYFQPKIDARVDKVIGLEALIRWNHPELGLIPPVKFIPFAENIGLIIEIDRWMMREAAAQVLLWKKENIVCGKLSINVSAKQLEDDNYVEFLSQKINDIGIDPKDLEIEITEGLIMKHSLHVTSTLNAIRELGISISVDDFGTGYSSLSYLKRLPIDKLKIDRSFVKDLPHDKDDIAIVKTIIALANNLSLELIAEGVETKEQRDFLLSEGCHNIQGYFYSKPLKVNECREFLLNYM